MANTLLITGATSGIGLALAKSSVQKGHQVIVTGRNAEKLSQVEQQLGCRTILADSEDLIQLQNMATTLARENIKLDGLVLNAGVFYPDSFASTSAAAFDHTMNINTKGPFFTLQYLLPCLNNPASVVLVSSIVVHKGFQGCATYSASKAASEAFVRVANMELAAHGIRINSVRPGVTATEIQAKAGMTDTQQAELFASLNSTPLGRVLSPDDHVGAIEYLLSDQSVALRNAVIDVDGGYTL